MGRFLSKRVLSRLFLGVASKAVGFYLRVRDKDDKFVAENLAGVASGDMRDLFSAGVVRYFNLQQIDKTRHVYGEIYGPRKQTFGC